MAPINKFSDHMRYRRMFGDEPEPNDGLFEEWQEYYTRSQWVGNGYDALPPLRPGDNLGQGAKDMEDE